MSELIGSYIFVSWPGRRAPGGGTMSDPGCAPRGPARDLQDPGQMEAAAGVSSTSQPTAHGTGQRRRDRLRMISASGVRLVRIAFPAVPPVTLRFAKSEIPCGWAAERPKDRPWGFKNRRAVCSTARLPKEFLGILRRCGPRRQLTTLASALGLGVPATQGLDVRQGHLCLLR